MISRKDLAKEFQVVVQQEIRNTQRHIDGTNSRIEGLNNDIKSLGNEFDERISKLENQLVQEKIKLSSHKENLSDSRTSESRDNHFKFNSIYGELSNLKISRENTENELKQNSSSLYNLHNLIMSLYDDLRNLKKTVFESFEHFEGLNYASKKYIENIKEEILNRPSEAQAVKKVLEEAMKKDRVDFEGLVREIELIKKSSFVIEKKIEDIYSEIKNFKKAKA